MKHIVKISSIIVFIVFLFSTALADTLYLEGTDTYSSACQQLKSDHPALILETTPHNAYFSTTQLVGQLVSHEFKFDVFTMDSSTFDIQKLISKGYCCDLKNSQIITDMFKNMYEPIKNQVVQNENIFGVPDSVDIRYMMYDEKAWAAAGLESEDVPTSFADFLDFLDRWVERIAIQPEDHISVCNSFDEALYNESSYTVFLTDKLIENHIMQCAYAGEPLRFDTPLFCELLNRCQSIGKALYEYEPREKGEMQLFYDFYGMRTLNYLVPLRLTKDQPILIKANLHVHFLNAASVSKELAMEYLENVVTAIEPETAAYLFHDIGPIENKSYQSNLQRRINHVLELQNALQNDELSTDERDQLELRLEDASKMLSAYQTVENQFIVLESDLALYEKYAPNMFFQAPSVFNPESINGRNMQQLRDQFCAGQLPLQRFVARLDELAWMVSTEDQ